MVYPPVWDASAFTFDFIVWYLAALGLLSLRHRPSAAQRASISSSGILPPLASSSDDIGLLPPGDGSTGPSRIEESGRRKAQE